MTTLKCEFCNKTYTTKSILNHHIKTAKKCILSRGQTVINNYECEYCDFKCLTKDSITKHLSTCKLKNKKYTFLELRNQLNTLRKEYEVKLEKKDILIERLEKDLKECKEQINSNFNVLASKPSVVNNTNNTKINNLVIVDFKESSIKDKIENNFTLEYLNDGIKGVAKFTKEHIVASDKGNPTYICSDPSRAIFKYRDENGIIQKDIKATKLKNVIKDPLISKSKILFIKENSRLFDDIAKAEDDNEITDMMIEQITTLKDNFLKVKNIDDNQSDYAKEMVLAMIE